MMLGSKVLLPPLISRIASRCRDLFLIIQYKPAFERKTGLLEFEICYILDAVSYFSEETDSSFSSGTAAASSSG